MAVVALDRQRACRARQREGLRIFRFQADEAAMIAFLEKCGLDPNKADDPLAVEAALTRAMGIILEIEQCRRQQHASRKCPPTKLLGNAHAILPMWECAWHLHAAIWAARLRWREAG